MYSHSVTLSPVFQLLQRQIQSSNLSAEAVRSIVYMLERFGPDVTRSRLERAVHYGKMIAPDCGPGPQFLCDQVRSESACAVPQGPQQPQGGTPLPQNPKPDPRPYGDACTDALVSLAEGVAKADALGVLAAIESVLLADGALPEAVQLFDVIKTIWTGLSKGGDWIRANDQSLAPALAFLCQYRKYIVKLNDIPTWMYFLMPISIAVKIQSGALLLVTKCCEQQQIGVLDVTPANPYRQQPAFVRT